MEIVLLLGAVALATASQYKTPEKHDHKFTTEGCTEVRIASLIL